MKWQGVRGPSLRHRSLFPIPVLPTSLGLGVDLPSGELSQCRYLWSLSSASSRLHTNHMCSPAVHLLQIPLGMYKYRCITPLHEIECSFNNILLTASLNSPAYTHQVPEETIVTIKYTSTLSPVTLSNLSPQFLGYGPLTGTLSMSFHRTIHSIIWI